MSIVAFGGITLGIGNIGSFGIANLMSGFVFIIIMILQEVECPELHIINGYKGKSLKMNTKTGGLSMKIK